MGLLLPLFAEGAPGRPTGVLPLGLALLVADVVEEAGDGWLEVTLEEAGAEVAVPPLMVTWSLGGAGAAVLGAGVTGVCFGCCCGCGVRLKILSIQPIVFLLTCFASW
ncbi:MAG: hypothetical protein EB084_06505 [Proteobacteria bacterium]|nr:hypothetical protein [Pseudomonadota bacterium]